MSLGDLPIAGIVTEVGGSTSHAAILARSRGIPAVSGVDGIMTEVESGDLMIVDGRDGMVILRPDQEATSAYRKVQREFFNIKDRLVANRDLPALSADGTRVELLANINNLADAQAAPQGRRHRRRALPHRVPLPHPPRRARARRSSTNITGRSSSTRPIRRSRSAPSTSAATRRCPTWGGGASPTPSWAGARPGSSSRTPSCSSPRSGRSSAPAGTGMSRCSFPMITNLEELLLREQAGQGDAAAI